MMVKKKKKKREEEREEGGEDPFLSKGDVPLGGSLQWTFPVKLTAEDVEHRRYGRRAAPRLTSRRSTCEI